MNTQPRTGRAQGPRVIRPQQEQERQLLPRCAAIPRPNAPFTLVHAHQWEFCPTHKGGSWLPEVTEIRHEPGCNGVSRNGDPAAAITGHARKKSIPIYNGDARLPADLRHYLASYDMQGGGKFYCFPSVIFSWLQGGRAIKAVHNRGWEFRFREALYDLRIVPPMSPDVLETHLAIIDEQIARRRRRAAEGRLSQDALREQVAELRDERQTKVDAYERQFGELDDYAPVDGVVDLGAGMVAPRIETGAMGAPDLDEVAQRPPSVLQDARPEGLPQRAPRELLEGDDAVTVQPAAARRERRKIRPTDGGDGE